MSVMRKHKFLCANLVDLCVKEFRLDCMPPVQKKRRVDMRDESRETVRDC